MIRLPAELIVAELVSLRPILDEVLATSSLGERAPIELDASAVRRLDAAGAQLLVVFVREVRARGRRVNWHGVGDAFRVTTDRIGVTGPLGLSVASLESLPAIPSEAGPLG